MPTTASFLKPAAGLCLLLQASAARSQAKPNPSMIQLPARVASIPAAPAAPPPPHPMVLPTPMAAAELLQLRPTLAQMFHVSMGPLPARIVEANNLAVPGNVVRVYFGQAANTSPNGFHWKCGQADMSSAAPWLSSPSIRTDGYTFSLWILSENTPPGKYLLTIYVGGAAATSVFSPLLNVNNTVTEYTNTPVQDGRLFVPFSLATTSSVGVRIKFGGSAPNPPVFRFYFYDFLRLM